MADVETGPVYMGEHEVVVIGTGFGGAVAACRLAQAGRDVLVLERGRRYGRGDFPRRRRDPWFWQTHHGPFDIRPFGEVVLVQAAGYGGGSLLYSNVHLRVPVEGFAQGWPAGWTRDLLDPYYDLVAHMLEISPIADSQPMHEPPRTARMEEAARATGRHAQFFRPPLALTLTAPGKPVRNRHGKEQRGCTHCAECSIGCNVGAKNSLDHNYLAVAEDEGARMRPSCEVTALSRDGSGYRVDYRDRVHANEKDRGRRFVRARTLVLAAGTANTTELLLRHGHDLGVTSERVGERYSANGDFLSAGLETERPFAADVGPAITCGIVYSEGPAPGDPWLLVQDGGFPASVAALVLSALKTADRHGEVIDRVLAATGGGSRRMRRAIERFVERHAPWADEEQDGGREVAELPTRALFAVQNVDPAAEHAAILLAMGRDTSDGRLHRRPWPWRHPGLEWNLAANEPLYAAEQALCDEIVAEGMGARPVRAPGGPHFRLPVSVHNLGGAVMAGDPEHGVVDAHGEVFGCPGLFVVDGAAIPEATGVNPSHTIAAVAERNVERLVRRLTGDPTWSAPERAVAPRHHDPLPNPPPGGTTPVRRGRPIRLQVQGEGQLAGVDGTRTHALRLVIELSGRTSETPPATAVLLQARGEITIGGLGKRSGTLRLTQGVVVPGPEDWAWTLPFATGPDRYVLEGWSTPGELRLALHRGVSVENRVIALGTLRIVIT